MEKTFIFSYLARLSNRRAWMSILVDSLRPPRHVHMCDEDGHSAFFRHYVVFPAFSLLSRLESPPLRNTAGGFAIRSSSN